MKRFNFPKLPWMNRLGMVVGGAVAIVASFAVASLLFIVLLAVGGAVAIWVWWTYRQMIKNTRKAPPGLIEGEYTVDPAQPLLEDQRPPARRSRPNRKSRRGHSHPR
jgi:hypothetical protein